MTSGHSALSIPDIDKTREHVSTERTNEGGPAPVVNPTIDHPPPRQPTPQPSREQDPCENSVEATEVDRPGASLPAMPGPEKEELHSEMKHHGIPPTVIGTEIEVTSHTDEPYQPKGVPFPQQRPESPAISEILRDSLVLFLSYDRVLIHLIIGTSFSPDEPASTDSRPLPRSTHPEMDKSLEPPMLAVSSEDLDASPGAEMLLSTDPSEIIRQDEGGIEQQLESSKTATWGPTQNEDDSDSSDEQGGQLSRRNSQNSNTISKEDLKENNSPATPPVLPPAPANSPSREELVREIADLTDRAVSISLFGSVGIGKSFVALTLLHHNRTKAKFGQNRYFMRCEDLQNSLEAFLERLSETIQTEVAKLRPRLRSSPPLILFLDGIDSILEPETSQSQEISAAIEEFGNYEHVCLVTTSRIHPEIRGFCRVEVPTLTEDGARDIFYSLCNLSRSPAVDSLIASLDFHPLAIELLASCVRGNDWDEPTLLKAWEDDQAGVLKTGDDQRLKDAIEPVLRSSAIAGLEIPALVVLGAIAASQFGVKECELEKGISGTGKAVDVLSKFSLVYRQDGLVKMFAPIRSYFVEFAPVLTPREQVLCEDVDFMPGACMSPLFYPFHSCGVTHFEGLSVYDSGRLDGDTSRTIQGPGARPGWNWNLGLPGSVIRSDHDVSNHIRMITDPSLMVSQSSVPF